MKRIQFCDGWEFSHGDAAGFVPVVVPHDALTSARRGPDAPAGSASGYHFGIRARYRKRFTVSAEQSRKTLLVEFEGIYRNALLKVNGEDVPAPPYGFVPFFVDVSHLIHEGENEIEVEADCTGQPDCRWYSGAGIHRPVWLWEGGQARIQPEGVKVTTLSHAPARIRVQVDCTGGTPRVSLVSPDGGRVAEGTGTDLVFELEDAMLWSAEHPDLYTCAVELHDGDTVADKAEVDFGIRTIEWGPKGLFVNGCETLLRGGCIHCDNGILGAASHEEFERWRVGKLREQGFNALRIAHNPAPTALLKACDELGMYVMDETWDVWYTPKSAHDYSADFLDWCDYDLARLASRDYNHPSVIMYSVGNEVADPITPEGVRLERSLVELLHSLDPTRPVTCGLNLTMMVMERIGRGWYRQTDGVAEAATSSGAPRGSLLFNLGAQAAGSGMTLLANAPGADRLVSPALDALDIAGYNYASKRYAVDVRKHPQRIIVGTETFPHEIKRNWDMVVRYPAVIGDFMWAAWDYLGEAGAGAWAYTADEAGFSKPWPWLLAGSGAIDLTGVPSAHAALAAAVWKTAKGASIQVRPVNRMKGKTYKATWRGSDAVPSWSWNGCDGTVAAVEVYDGRAKSIRLELNGEVIGTSRLNDCVARFNVAYHPGTLRAISLDEDGRVIGKTSLSSTAAPFHLSARLINAHPKAGGIALVEICICGSNGLVESNADELLEAFVVDGALLGFGSGKPAPTERFTDGAYPSHYGRAMAAVHRAEPGRSQLNVSGKHLGTAHIDIDFS